MENYAIYRKINVHFQYIYKLLAKDTNYLRCPGLMVKSLSKNLKFQISSRLKASASNTFGSSSQNDHVVMQGKGVEWPTGCIYWHVECNESDRPLTT